MNESAERMLATVRALAAPRFPGGEAERHTAAEIERRLAALGLTTVAEPFEACREVVPRLRRRLHGAVALAILIAAGVGTASPLGTALLAAATLVFVARSGRWSVRVEEEFDLPPRLASRNVTARRPPAAGGAAGGAADARGRAAPVLVVLAHVDSKSARFPTAVPVALVLFAAAVTIGLLAWGVVAAVTGTGAAPGTVLLPPAMLAAVALLVAQANPAGDASPGAVDNASGLAVLLECARTLPHDPTLAGLDLRFVATGAEEIGLAGAVRWIRAHGDTLDPARTLFVNVDSVGVGGGLVALDVGGRAPDGRPMAAAVEAAACAAGVRVRRLPFLPGVGVDTMPIRARGFATVSLLGSNLGAIGARIHSARDGVDGVDGAGLARAAAVVTEIARGVAGSD